MKYKVSVIGDAEDDIINIYNYIMHNDSIENAEYVLESIYKTCLSLDCLPNRGHIIPEFRYIGLLEYREIHFKPYRIIYRIINSTVYVHCVLDGRQNLQTQLEHRLLR